MRWSGKIVETYDCQMNKLQLNFFWVLINDFKSRVYSSLSPSVRSYFEYFGPDFKLHIAPSNMSNQNTTEYMDKIRSRLLENLRMLPHAPGVQMQDIPEDSVDINKDKEEEDGEDKDKRVTMKMMDKRIEPENEFESGKSGNKNSVNHGETNGAEPMETDNGSADS